jgi:hypothetical protein
MAGACCRGFIFAVVIFDVVIFDVAIFAVDIITLLREATYSQRSVSRTG